MNIFTQFGFIVSQTCHNGSKHFVTIVVQLITVDRMSKATFSFFTTFAQTQPQTHWQAVGPWTSSGSLLFVKGGSAYVRVIVMVIRPAASLSLLATISLTVPSWFLVFHSAFASLHLKTRPPAHTALIIDYVYTSTVQNRINRPFDARPRLPV